MTTPAPKPIAPPEEAAALPASIILVSHILVTGPAQELYQFLRTRNAPLLYITHPLQPFTPVGNHRSGYEQSLSNAVVRQHSVPQWPMPHSVAGELVLFGRQAWLTFWWAFRHGGRSDLYIGIDPLNALVGLALKRCGRVRRVVYYVIDYVPTRFSNRWVNALYHWVDRTCVQGCDRVWNLSSRMVTAREHRGVAPRYRDKQRTLPIGTDLRVTPRPIEQVERRTVVYFGGLMVKQGVHLAIEALVRLRAVVPDARLVVMGGGQPERERALKQLASSLGVADAVEFLGVIACHEEALERLTRCAVGIAPYTDDPDNFTQYTDPGKPKAYLAAGLPVVMTGVPEVGEVIERAGAGKVIPYDAQALADALARYLTDETMLAEAKRRARALAEEYDWNRLFATAFSELPR